VRSFAAALTAVLVAIAVAPPALAQGAGPAPVAPTAEALTALRAAAQRGPLPLDASLALAQAEVAAGDREAAERHLAAAIERSGSVRAMMMLGRLQAERGDEAAALATVRGALAAAPNSEEVVSVYARLSLSTGTPAQALRALEALVRMHPEVAEHRYLLGVSLIQLGDLQRARSVLGETIRLAPALPRARVALGLVLNRLSHFAEAREELTAALRLAPDDLEALAALAEAEEGLGELEGAERRARRVLAKAPGHATASLVLGLVMMERERYAEARDALLAAVAAEPGSIKAHYQLSLAYARLGDRERSAAHAERSQRARRETEERFRAVGGKAPGGMGP
jgi:protein O-GlcNAc transferase